MKMVITQSNDFTITASWYHP